LDRDSSLPIAQVPGTQILVARPREHAVLAASHTHTHTHTHTSRVDSNKSKSQTKLTVRRFALLVDLADAVTSMIAFALVVTSGGAGCITMNQTVLFPWNFLQFVPIGWFEAKKLPLVRILTGPGVGIDNISTSNEERGDIETLELPYIVTGLHESNRKRKSVQTIVFINPVPKKKVTPFFF
jgi:hypothetical protein